MRPRTPTASLLLFVALFAALPAALPAQTPIEGPQWDPPIPPPPENLLVPGYFTTFDFSALPGMPVEIVSGLFDADTLIDLAVRDSSSVRFAIAADLFAIPFGPQVAATGLASYRPVEATRDALIIATATGLSRVTIGSGGSVDVEDLGHPAWAGAVSLEIGAVGGTATPDLVGVSPGGDILLLLDIDDATPAESSFSTLSAALEVILADWDGDGTSEIVPRAENGVRVHEPDGSLVTKFRGYHPAGAITRIPGAGGDTLAWATYIPQVSQSVLVTLSLAGGATSVPLGPDFYQAIAAGDLDGDGDADLVLRSGSGGDATILLGAANVFDPADGDLAQVIEGIPGDGPEGEPHFLDIDGDGDEDCVWGRFADLCVVRSGAIDERSLSPDFLTVRFDSDETTGQAYLEFEFLDGAVIPAGSTHLQAAIWRRASPFDPMDLVAYSSFLEPIPAPLLPPEEPPPDPDDPPGEPGGPTSPYPQWDVPLVETGEMFLAVYTIVIRYVTLDAEGDVVATGPAREFLFTSEGDDEIGTLGVIDWILQHAGHWLAWYYAIPDVVIPPDTEPEFSSSGTVIETKPPPDPPEDEEPDFGDSGGDP